MESFGYPLKHSHLGTKIRLFKIAKSIEPMSSKYDHIATLPSEILDSKVPEPFYFNIRFHDLTKTIQSPNSAIFDDVIKQVSNSQALNDALSLWLKANQDYWTVQVPEDKLDITLKPFALVWPKDAASEIIVPERPEIIVEQTAKIRHIIAAVGKDPSILSNINPRVFEEMVAELMHSDGFEVEITKQTKDGGYDIVAYKSLDRHNRIKFLVECKRYNRPIGIDIVRSFRDVLNSEGANRGIIVATSHFSPDAIKKISQTPFLLEYRDKPQLMKWIETYLSTGGRHHGTKEE